MKKKIKKKKHFEEKLKKKHFQKNFQKTFSSKFSFKCFLNIFKKKFWRKIKKKLKKNKKKIQEKLWRKISWNFLFPNLLRLPLEALIGIFRVSNSSQNNSIEQVSTELITPRTCRFVLLEVTQWRCMIARKVVITRPKIR